MKIKKNILPFLGSMLLIFGVSGCEELINKVVNKALTFKDVTYVWGGETYKGIDCSGLIQASFAAAGYKLPRRAVDQSQQGQTISLKRAKKGDLLFFQKGSEIDHVGLVIGGSGENVQFIHASGVDGKVLISQFSNSERKTTFVRAQRIF
jgi:cell wall-associated NlpC family hydrolase